MLQPQSSLSALQLSGGLGRGWILDENLVDVDFIADGDQNENMLQNDGGPFKIVRIDYL